MDDSKNSASRNVKIKQLFDSYSWSLTYFVSLIFVVSVVILFGFPSYEYYHQTKIDMLRSQVADIQNHIKNNKIILHAMLHVLITRSEAEHSCNLGKSTQMPTLLNNQLSAARFNLEDAYYTATVLFTDPIRNNILKFTDIATKISNSPTCTQNATIKSNSSLFAILSDTNRLMINEINELKEQKQLILQQLN